MQSTKATFYTRIAYTACMGIKNGETPGDTLLRNTPGGGTLSAASGIHLGAIHLIDRPYASYALFPRNGRFGATLFVANKGPACLRAARTGRRNHHGDS